MSDEINPYLAPQSDLAAPRQTMDYYVDGKDLICRSGAVFPARCIKTNEEIGEGRMKMKPLYWMNPWFYLLIFIHFLILIIVHFCVRKRVEVTFGMSKGARSRRTLHMLGFWLVFLASFFALCAGIPLELPIVSVGGAVGLIASLIWLAKIGSILRVKRDLHDGLFALRGCAPEFLASIEQERREAPVLTSEY